ncbi:3-dehydroquinate synthase [Streptococcus pneumoniae]|nr:3-dehydroquinate synthase [Streptococcus pneumoniae]UIK85573.1 3-dehydroquinate synthase [Streptococcus pneumoniae]UIK87605.1 3-dehydroquinate synthase [Streptococcus pneumoniae]
MKERRQRLRKSGAFGGQRVRYFKILCIVLFASLLVACHQISSGTVVDKYIDEPHTTFIPVINGKSSVLVPTRTKRKYILVVSGYAGNKQVEETFEVTANEYKHYEIGNTFIQDAVLENKEEDKE